MTFKDTDEIVTRIEELKTEGGSESIIEELETALNEIGYYRSSGFWTDLIPENEFEDNFSNSVEEIKEETGEVDLTLLIDVLDKRYTDIDILGKRYYYSNY